MSHFNVMAGVLMAGVVSTTAYGQVDASKAEQYRRCVQTCLDNLLKYGADRYGEVHTPMLMSIIDVRTNDAPREPLVLDGMVRSEGRLHRRNPGGCDLWDDQPLLRTMYAFSELNGDAKYAQAADAYTKSFFERSRKANGMLAWGTHIFYDAFKDAPGGDQDGKGPHEILVLCPNWDRMWKVTPDLVRKEIEGIWEWHVVDKSTGLNNRHDDKLPGCDFAFSGGEFAYAFAYLYSQTKKPEHLQWAKTVAGRHWNARNLETNLAPDAPGTGDRYDAHHCFTTVSGPHAALLLKAYEASGDPWFKEVALAYINAYLKYGWDAKARQYCAMLTLDGKPVMEQAKGAGYDAFKPTGYVDIWRTIMYSYEFPVEAAQTALYAYELTGDVGALQSAKNWAENIRANLPPHLGRRWRKEIVEALPEAERVGGTYAENYGRAISFFLHLHYATRDAQDLKTSMDIADEAISKLYADGWFKGHPAKPYYESTDGVSYLLFALTELSAYPNRMACNL
ncbi:MAG: hypothetical protein HZB26_25720 [Candidatus Hydrogenedentes bacterium]|nr:hypothetical protein [Candidatus Hydrogenedentota bacterium]